MLAARGRRGLVASACFRERVSHRSLSTSTRIRTVLGIESSCDDSCAAVLRLEHAPGAPSPTVTVLSDVRASQTSTNTTHGGVVPHLAAREHEKNLPIVVQQALSQAFGEEPPRLDAVAVTVGPGLVLCLRRGLRAARAVQKELNVPCVIGVNHLEAHIGVGVLLEPTPPSLPALALLVSGGHSLVLRVDAAATKEDGLKITELGSTLDDSLGEAFDKVARLLQPRMSESMLKLPQDGALVEALARRGRPRPELRLSVPMRGIRSKSRGEDEANFSFSGLKSAVARLLSARPEASSEDVARSFQFAALEHVGDVLEKAHTSEVRSLIVCGGVARNEELRSRLANFARDKDVRLVVPKASWCTDNAVMIAALGGSQLLRGRERVVPEAEDDRTVRSRWSPEYV